MTHVTERSASPTGKKFGKQGLLLAAALSIGACAAKPRAELALIQKPGDLNGGELDTYAFPRTFLDLTPAASGTDVQITTRRVSYEPFRIAIRRRDSFGVRTNLNTIKSDNTDIIKEAGVQVFDDRIKIIEDLGKIGTTLVGLGLTPFAGGGSLELPYTMDTLKLMSGLSRAGSTQDTDTPSGWQSIKGIGYWFGPIPPDALEVNSANVAAVGNGLVYAACREMRLYFAGDRVVKHLVVSDPRYLRRVAFPQKGKIVIANECGASVTSEKDDAVARDTAVGEAILQQIKALKDAVDARKKEEEEEASEAGVPQADGTTTQTDGATRR